ncbi:Hypothetical predicted protein, partial [Paramuricea clavata]
DKLKRDEKVHITNQVSNLFCKLPDYLSKMPNAAAATVFLEKLNDLHPNLSFTMELPVENKILLVGMEISRDGSKVKTQVYRKSTNTGLLLHFNSHTDKRYKEGLLKTMVHRAYALSSTREALDQECSRLRSIFTHLDYPTGLIDSTIQKVIKDSSNNETRNRDTDESNVVRFCLPFKDQIAANAVRKQMVDLSRKIGVHLQPVFTSRKLEQQLKPREVKVPIINRQCVVYKFQCDLCDADSYIGFTGRHLHQRIAEHKLSTIGKHFCEAHGNKDLLNESQFHVLRKCQNKSDCLVYEMLYIKDKQPSLNEKTGWRWQQRKSSLVTFIRFPDFTKEGCLHIFRGPIATQCYKLFHYPRQCVDDLCLTPCNLNESVAYAATWLDEAFYLVSKDIVESYLSRRDTLVCHVWESQAIGYWTKNISDLTTFADNKRLLHMQTGFSSEQKVLKRTAICHSVLAIHKSYPEKMRLFWSIYEKEDKPVAYQEVKISYGCRYPLAMDYRTWGKKSIWFSEPKLCKDNPIWDRNGEYKGRQGH